eukprot:TRINITY_DN67792_c1_g10_i1.p1 TRINITY_DN67792_c1_g10~~TRINITY_DN67792_c1_g10_i1.p1  ORF type:complete len:539 (+),score=43.67 TRINITY_DN67792_c1_g10_i1:83-1699(+)
MELSTKEYVFGVLVAAVLSVGFVVVIHELSYGGTNDGGASLGNATGTTHRPTTKTTTTTPFTPITPLLPPSTCTLSQISTGDWTRSPSQFVSWSNISELARITDHKCLGDPVFNTYRYQCAWANQTGADAQGDKGWYDALAHIIVQAWKWDWTVNNCTMMHTQPPTSNWNALRTSVNVEPIPKGAPVSPSSSLLVEKFIEFLGTDKMLFLGDSVSLQMFWELLCLLYDWIEPPTKESAFGATADVPNAHMINIFSGHRTFTVKLKTGATLQYCMWHGNKAAEHVAADKFEMLDECRMGTSWVLMNSGTHWPMQIHQIEAIQAQWNSTVSTVFNTAGVKGLTMLDYHKPVQCHPYKYPIDAAKYNFKVEFLRNQGNHPYRWEYATDVEKAYIETTNTTLGPTDKAGHFNFWMNSSMLNLRLDAHTQIRKKIYDCIHYCCPSFPVRLQAFLFMQGWLEGHFKPTPLYEATYKKKYRNPLHQRRSNKPAKQPPVKVHKRARLADFSTATKTDLFELSEEEFAQLTLQRAKYRKAHHIHDEN